MVIRHFDRRFIRRDESTGQPVFSVDFKNTYYHLDVSHVRRKNPYFDGKVTVSIEQYHSFDSAQNARISSSSGFQIMLTSTVVINISNNITLQDVFIIVL